LIDASRRRRRVADLWIHDLFSQNSPRISEGLQFFLTSFVLLDIVEYYMIASTSHQPWLFYSPLAQQAVLLKDDLLDPVDQLLDDPALVGNGPAVSGQTQPPVHAHRARRYRP
jgi:hypothetical protein